MKKKIVVVLLAYVLLFSSISVISTLKTAIANFIPTVTVEIKSPVNGTTYDATPLLQGHVNFYAWGNRSKHFVYSVDGSANDTLTGNFVTIDEICWFNISTALPKLSLGKHSIKVYAWVDVQNNPGLIDNSYSEVTFYVIKETSTLPDGTPYKPPIVTVLSPPPNGTISNSDVPLNVTVQIFGFVYHNMENINWLNYSLDGQSAVQMKLILPQQYSPGYYVYASDMLLGLSEGTHNLTIYGETRLAWVERFDETISFKIDAAPSPIADNPQTTSIIAIVSIVVVVFSISVVVLVYLEKRERK